MSESDEIVTAFIIGDPHFIQKNLHGGIKFISKVIEAAREKQPTFIVVLGDILDKHDVGEQQAFNLSLKFFKGLCQIAPVYILIGNHDYLNNKQFLTEEHWFNGLKEWSAEKVGHEPIIVDKAIYAEYGDCCFAFCPYVEPGRFVEALDTLIEYEGATWDIVDCIFAHQEFKGCKMGAKISTEGDEWNKDFPPVISGHIHNSQEIGGNIFYTGSSVQHAFGESPNKKVWFVTFDDLDEPPYFSVEKIRLHLKGKKIITMHVKDIEKFDLKTLRKYQIKLTLKGSSEEFGVFKKSDAFTKLNQNGVKIAYARINDITRDSLGKRSREQASFLGVLSDIIKMKTKPAQEAYQQVVGNVDVLS